jgi:hypothetical protein
MPLQPVTCRLSYAAPGGPGALGLPLRRSSNEGAGDERAGCRRLRALRLHRGDIRRLHRPMALVSRMRNQASENGTDRYRSHCERHWETIFSGDGASGTLGRQFPTERLRVGTGVARCSARRIVKGDARLTLTTCVRAVPSTAPWSPERLPNWQDSRSKQGGARAPFGIGVRQTRRRLHPLSPGRRSHSRRRRRHSGC